jgi:hypothetical protein
VTIHGRTDLHFTYVPSHISYMLLELLKNSMRATVETHGTDKMPPIKIVIADGEANEDVSANCSNSLCYTKRVATRRVRLLSLICVSDRVLGVHDSCTRW